MIFGDLSLGLRTWRKVTLAYTSAEPQVCMGRLRTLLSSPYKVSSSVTNFDLFHRLSWFGRKKYVSNTIDVILDTPVLIPPALPKVVINIRTAVQTVMLGSSVEFECHATGDPEPTVQWSKVDGTLFSHVVVKGGLLTINRVTEADAGKYYCTATNNVGSVQSEVVLNVQSK